MAWKYALESLAIPWILFIELLWRAPEVLRNSNVDPTREGDIYSAGIVMYEIITRNGPFENERLDIGTDGKWLI